MLIHIYIYLLIHRDGRFRVNDEIINVNGSSLRGLSMEQVFSFVLFSNNRYSHVVQLLTCCTLYNVQIFSIIVTKPSLFTSCTWCLQARNVLKNTSQNVDIIIARSPEGELNFLALDIKKTLNCWRRRQRGQKPGSETVDPEKEKTAGDDIQLYCEIFLISLILGDNAHNYCEFRGIFCIIEKG